MITPSPMSSPFSGDLWFNNNPLTSWWAETFRGAMIQNGFINVYETRSSDAEMERDIVANQASYGKQLGRIVEALQALCNHIDSSDWTQAEQDAVRSFVRMAEEIDEYKRTQSRSRR